MSRFPCLHAERLADLSSSSIFTLPAAPPISRSSQGRKVDFKNTVIVCTSNLGSNILVREDSTLLDGTVTDAAQSQVLEVVASRYPPELVRLSQPLISYKPHHQPSTPQLNRLDEQIVFNSLSPQNLAEIVTLRLREVQQALTASDRRIELLVEQGARDWLASEGYEPRWGARALNRLVNRQVRQPLASALLRGTIR